MFMTTKWDDNDHWLDVYVHFVCIVWCNGENMSTLTMGIMSGMDMFLLSSNKHIFFFFT